MAELLVIRHGQASFGAADYDCLSQTGRVQARRAGDWLRATGWVPDRVLTGTLTRQIDTAAEMGFDPQEQAAGFDEYDSKALLSRRPAPHGADRRTYFRHLRGLVHDWIDGEDGTGESWPAFCDRVAQARAHATRPGARRVLAISSGGVVGRLVAETLGAPERAMMALNLQVRNTAMTRWVYSDRGFHLHSFNCLPHLAGADDADLETYA